MLLIRRLAFAAVLYLSVPIAGILLSPLLLASRRRAISAAPLWAGAVMAAARLIMGIRVELRGLEHRPTGSALIAGKHQSMLDTIAPFTFLHDTCFVMKKELMGAPVFGWYARKFAMVSVDREAHASALKRMVRDVRDRLRDSRQVLIFPEGTRTAPGASPVYKPGVAALYRDLGLPCHLLATNSGDCWPAHGIGFNPGVVVFEFLPPLPPGLKRPELMAELEASLESASARLRQPL